MPWTHPQSDPNRAPGLQQLAEERGALQMLRCAMENSGAQVYSIQFVDDPRWSHIENHMLLIVGAIIVLIAVVIISRMRGPRRMDARNHGWMSERWLAEQRASDSH